MITSFTIENFRGIERLHAEGLGRVNLVTGKNDCGKTATIEALWAAETGNRTAEIIARTQQMRSPRLPINDLENFWRPIFRNGDMQKPLLLDITMAQGFSFQYRMWQEKFSGLVKEASADQGSDTVWSLEIECVVAGKTDHYQLIGTGKRVQFPSPESDLNQSVWNSGRPELTAPDLRRFSELKQAGRDGAVVEMMQQIDPAIRGIEFLAPTGREVTPFMRLANGAPMLALQLMGEGTQRCFEIAVAAASMGDGSLFLDEIENGIHHSALRGIWNWIASLSAQRNFQVFATTHSEECVHAACAAFTAAGDEGLRVVRLERREHETIASVYDRRLIEASAQMGVDLRG